MEGVVAIAAMFYLAFAVVAFVLKWLIVAYLIGLAALLVALAFRWGFRLVRYLVR